MTLLSKYVGMLRCPDDQAEITHSDNVFQCIACERVFPTYSNNVIELLPSKPYPLELNTALEKSYWQVYQRLLKEKMDFSLSAKGWGYIPKMSCGLRSFIKREREIVKNYVGENVDEIVCDVCAGAGTYSLELAKTAKLVVHCDIDFKSIIGASIDAKQNKLDNILFVRSDCLQLPFVNGTFNSILCIDALERGLAHELRLLQEFVRCLKASGKFAADFHNKRIISSRDIFEYDEQKVRQFIRRTNIHNYKIDHLGYVHAPFVFSESIYGFLDRLFKMFFTSQRLLVMGVK